MRERETIDPDQAQEAASALALRALVWALVEPDRALRLLSLTGLEPTDLRTRAGDPEVLAAAIGFLEAYEPDLVACADALDVKPGDLVAARAVLEVV